MKKTSSGFTIVELLIVIVVIAILAAITIVAYNGLQQRARDSQRDVDVATIQKALDLYYIDNGQYPVSSCSSSCAINTAWSTTADASWQNLANQLVPAYVSSFPRDPVSKQTVGYPWNDAGGYDYSYSAWSPPYCGVTGTRQGYTLVYKYEGKANVNTGSSSCTATVVGPYGGSAASNIYKLNK